MWPIDRPPQWVGRGPELATLRAGVEALCRDEGAVVWVEGEPGIGKSSLVVEALAGVSEPGWDIGWGFADQLTERMPLSVMQDCLQVRPGSIILMHDGGGNRSQTVTALKTWLPRLLDKGYLFTTPLARTARPGLEPAGLRRNQPAGLRSQHDRRLQRLAL